MPVMVHIYILLYNRNMLKLLIILTVLQLAFSIIDPSRFSEQISSHLPKQVTLVSKDIARTVNGYTVMAYGLTAIQQIPKKFQLTDFSHYPSSLIISYMHGTDQNAVNLLYGFAINLLNNYQQDYYIQYVLKTGFVWLIPFFNIDAYELVYRGKIEKYKVKQSIEKQFSKEQQSLKLKKTIKNMNKYPESDGPWVDCQKKDRFYGVNLNFNFLHQNRETYYDLCSDNYAGSKPFSEMETDSIRKLFQTLKITVVIDLQIGEDIWIYPTNQVWLTKNKYAHLYKDTIKKLQKKNIMIDQQNSTINNMEQYSGGFVNWAATQDALAFKYAITNKLQGQQLKKSISSAFSVIDMLLKKNAPIYNKFRNEDSKRLFVQSLSVDQFEMRCQIKTNLGETVQTLYNVQPGEVVEVTIELEEQNFFQISSKKEPAQIYLFLLGSLINQKIEVGALPLVSELPRQQVPHPKIRNSEKRLFILQIIFVTLFIGCIIVGGLVISKIQQRKRNKFIYSTLKDSESFGI